MRMIPRSMPKTWLAFGLLLIGCIVPLAVGVAAFIDPLVRDTRLPLWTGVSALESLPVDGTPRRFLVRVPRSDAWMKLPDEPVAVVFLWRDTDSGEVQALQGHYHAGCPVEYDPSSREFHVPCFRDTRFDRAGRRLHSVREWGDLRAVRSRVVEGDVYVYVPDATAVDF